MASGIINLNNSGQTSGGGYLMGMIQWSGTPNTETNRSSGVVQLYAKKASTTGTITTPTTGNWDCSLTVNGENLSQNVYAGITADWVLLLEKTFTVDHDSDGKKSFQIAATVRGPSGTSYSGLKTEGSGTAVMDDIPRASAMSFGELTLGTKNMGSITAASASFRHDIYLTVGSARACLCYDKKGGGSVEITPALGDFAPQITDAASKTGTLTLYTFDANRNALGSKSYSVTVRVPSSAAPSVASGWASAAYYNTGTAAENIAAFVQGYSKAKVTFDSGKITTKYGATIKRYKIVCGSVTDTASPYLTGVLTGTSATITCTVEDSRGYTASGTLTVSLYAYKKPALSDVALYRADEDGTANRAGLCIYARAKLTWSSIGGRNSCSLTGNFRLQSGSYPAAGTEMTSEAGILLTVAAAVTSTYVAKIEAKDSLGNTASYEATIPTDNVAFHIREGGQGAAFGKYSEEDDLLDVAWAARVRKALRLDVPLEPQYGGTGKSSAADAANALINALSAGSAAPVDADYYVSQYSGGGTTTTTYHRRPMSALWSYIKGKIGLDSNGILPVSKGGTGASTAAAAVQNLFASGSSVTSYPTKPGIYRTTGTNIFQHMTPYSSYGVLVIFKVTYAAHFYVDSYGNLYYGYSGGTFAEPSKWYLATAEQKT